MALQSSVSNKSVKAVLNFTDPDFGHQSVMDDIHRENIKMKLIPHEVVIDDMRPRAKDMSLQRNALVLIEEAPPAGDFYSTHAAIEQRYYPQCAALVKRLSNADHIECFGFALRGVGDKSPAGARGPVFNVHVDYSLPSTIAIAEKLAPKSLHAERQRWRIMMINVWRPLSLVERNPLAVVDGSTMSDRDLFNCKLNNARSEIPHSYGMNVAFSPAQRWYYVSQMRPDEALVFTLMDSDPNSVKWAAHSSFEDPSSASDAKPRRSIEVRTIAYFLT